MFKDPLGILSNKETASEKTEENANVWTWSRPDHCPVCTKQMTLQIGGEYSMYACTPCKVVMPVPDA